MYDILWSDGKATQEVRPVSDGVVPIGLCVIPTNWLDEGEKARFVSLKYMNAYNPESGSLTRETLTWGKDSNSLEQDPLKEYYTPYAFKNENDGEDKLGGYYYWSGNKDFKDLRDRDNWIYTLNYCKQNPNNYAIGDINGKQNTINISVEGNYDSNSYYANYDMKLCIAKYVTIGTQAGEWYIPATGELLHFIFRLRSDHNTPSINNKLAYIAKVYPKDCVINFSYNNPDEGFSYGYYWTSTVLDKKYAFCINSYNSSIKLDYGERSANNGATGSVIAFIQR